MPRFLWLNDRITQHTVLRGLVPGFALVMVLLGVAGLVAVRQSRQIRRSAAAIVSNQLTVTRLIQEAQAEEDTLAVTLYRLRSEESSDRRIQRLQELKEADRSLARLAEEASRTPDAPPMEGFSDRDSIVLPGSRTSSSNRRLSFGSGYGPLVCQA